MAVELRPSQRRTILEAAKAPSWRRASPKVRLAAIEALGVEATYEDPEGGHLDSSGGLQQRPSQGWGPASETITQDMEQFLRKAIPLADQYGTAGELAQAVQRSAFPGRYNARRGEARAIARDLFGGLKGPGHRGGGGGGGGVAAPAGGGAGPVDASGLDMSALLNVIGERSRPQPPVSGPPPSPLDARANLAMPTGYQAPVASSVQVPETPALSELLALVGGQRGEGLPGVEKPAGGGEAAGGGRSRGSGRKREQGFEIFEMFYDHGINLDRGRKVDPIGGHGTHVHVAAPRDDILWIAALAEEMGLSVRELEPYDKVDPVHTQGSFHYRKRAADISGPPKRLAEFNRRIAEMAR